MAIEKIVDVRHERSALSTKSNVRWAEIAYRRDTRVRRDDGTFADLQSGGGWTPEIIGRLALMENRLAVIANQVDAFRGKLESLARRDGSVSEDFSQAKIQLAEFACRNRLLLGHAKDFPAEWRRKAERSVTKQFGVQVRRCAGNASEGNVDTVGRSAGHKAEHQHGFGISHTMSFSTETAKGMEKS